MENKRPMRRSKLEMMSCKKHPKHRQSPGVCSLCLRDRLSKLASSSSRAVANASSSESSSSSLSSLSSLSSSGASSPMHRGPKGKGYLSFLRNTIGQKNVNAVLTKSRSMAFVAEMQKQEETEGKKKLKGGFWAKLIASRSKRMDEEGGFNLMHSRTTREMLTTRV